MPPGQFDLGSFLSSIVNPQTLAGAGLIGASNFGRNEPGYMTEARQYLRSPAQGEFEQIASDPALTQGYQGLLQQNERDVLNQAQQRVLAGRPNSLTTSMGGPEVSDLMSTSENILIPRRQALLTGLAQNLLSTNRQGAQQVLASGAHDQLMADLFSQGLGGLGGQLLQRGLGLNTLGNLQTGNPLIDALLLSGLGNNNQNPPGGGLGGLNLGNSSGGAGGLTSNLLQQLISSGWQGGNIIPAGAGIGYVPQTGDISLLGANGSPAGGAGSGFGSFLSGLNPFSASFAPGASTGIGSGLGTAFGGLGGLLSFLGTGGAGFGVGNLIGGLGGNELTSTLGGAAGGAATGAALGTFVFPGIGTALGAIIGGLTGGGGGFLSSSSAAKAQKAANLAADQRSQGDTTSQIGSFWTEALGAAGYSNLDGWGALVNQTNADVNNPAENYSLDGVSVNADQPDNLAYIGSRLLLRQIQQQHPEITNLDQVQGFRSRYVDFIMSHTFIEQGGQEVPTQNIAQKGGLLTQAGLSY